MTNTTHSMQLIQSLDPKATIEYSSYTKQFYVGANIYLGDGACLTGMVEHCPTPDEAVETYLSRLVEINLTNFDYFLVADYHGHRREYRWNGAGFQECTRPEALPKVTDAG